MYIECHCWVKRRHGLYRCYPCHLSILEESRTQRCVHPIPWLSKAFSRVFFVYDFPLRCYLRACSLPRQWLFLTKICLPFPLRCSSSPTSRLAPDSVLICSWEEAENTRSRPHPGHCPRPFLSSHHTVRGSSCPLFFRGLGGTCSGPILGGGGSHHQLETAGQGHKKFMVKAIGLCGLCSVPYVPSVTLKFLDFSMA